MDQRALYGHGSKARENLQAAMASLVSERRNTDVLNRVYPVPVGGLQKGYAEIAFQVNISMQN
jgi:hypothetical protein